MCSSVNLIVLFSVYHMQSACQYANEECATMKHLNVIVHLAGRGMTAIRQLLVSQQCKFSIVTLPIYGIGNYTFAC